MRALVALVCLLASGPLLPRVVAAQTGDGTTAPALGATGTGAAPDLVEAERRFRLAEQERRRVERARIRIPRPTTAAKMNEWMRTRFSPALRRRTEALRAAVSAYGAVAELGPTPFAVASARRVGDLHYDLAVALEAIPPPLEISRDPQLAAVFRDAMQQHTAALREQAYDAYEACLHLAARLALDDPHVQHARERLRQNAPERVPTPNGVSAED